MENDDGYVSPRIDIERMKECLAGESYTIPHGLAADREGFELFMGYLGRMIKAEARVKELEADAARKEGDWR